MMLIDAAPGDPLDAVDTPGIVEGPWVRMVSLGGYSVGVHITVQPHSANSIT
jgi:hypothetical protein